MNYKLIMLPQPILVNCEKTLSINGDYYLGHPNYTTIHKWDMRGIHEGKQVWINKIIAGIEGLPKLDLSLIAERVGWVDLETELKKVYKEFAKDVHQFDAEEYINSAEQFGVLELHKMIFKAAQSFNEKKFTMVDMEQAMARIALFAMQEGGKSANRIPQIIEDLLKPKEYQVEYTQEGNTIKVTKIII